MPTKFSVIPPVAAARRAAGRASDFLNSVIPSKAKDQLRLPPVAAARRAAGRASDSFHSVILSNAKDQFRLPFSL